MRKNILATLSILALVLAACDGGGSSEITTTTSADEPTTTTTSTSEDPVIDVDEEDIIGLISDLAYANINGYSYTSRVFSRSTLDHETIWTNSVTTTDYTIHSEGYEATRTSGTPATVSSITAEDPITGRLAAYVLEGDEYYITGFQASGDDHSSDYYQYNEYHKFVNFQTLALSDFTNNLSKLLYCIIDISLYYPTYSGYYTDGFEISFDDDGNVLYSATIYCDQVTYDYGEWGTYTYPDEKHTIEVLIDSDVSEVLSIVFTDASFVEDYDYNSDIDVYCDYYTYYSVSNISYGDVITDAVTPFDISDFSESQIYNTPSNIVTGVADGDIPEATVIEILSNYDAYLDGIIYAKQESRYDDITDTSTWETIGWGDYVEERFAYNDVLVVDASYDFDDEQWYDMRQYAQYVVTDTGVNYAIQTFYGEETTPSVSYSYEISGEYIGSLDYYMSASPFSSNYTFSECITFISNNGFYSNLSGWIQETSLISATKADVDGVSTITIEFTYHVAYEPYYNNYYTMKLVIEDDFLTSVTIDETNEGTYDHYTLQKGDLVDFTGTLI